MFLILWLESGLIGYSLGPGLKEPRNTSVFLLPPTSFLTESNESYLGSSQVRLTGGSQKPDYVGNPSQTETNDLRNSMTSELEIPSGPMENVNTKQEKKKNSWKY